MLESLPLPIQDAIFDALATLAVVLVTVLGLGLRRLQAALVEQARKRTESEAWRAAVDKLDTAAALAVDSVEQTVVRSIRETKASDNKLDLDEARRALDAAVAAAKLQIGTKGWVDLLDALDLTPERGDTLLRQTLEAKVRQAK